MPRNRSICPEYARIEIATVAAEERDGGCLVERPLVLRVRDVRGHGQVEQHLDDVHAIVLGELKDRQ